MKIKNMILTAACICLLCMLGGTQVYAAEYYGDFQYEDNGENVSIYAYNGSDKEVTIPAYINGKAVTEINDYTFLLCNSVEKIIVPSTVTTIHTNAFFGAGNLKSVVLASADSKIEESSENTDKKDTDEKGTSNSSDATDNKNGDNSGNKDAGSANKTDTKNTESDSTSTTNVTPQYKVTVDSTVDTAAEEKKLAEQYKKDSMTDDDAKTQNSGTKMQSSGTEIAGIDEGLDADETAIRSNADTASEKSQSMPVWEIILLVVATAIAVVGAVGFCTFLFENLFD